jgi:hypothetical protein
MGARSLVFAFAIVVFLTLNQRVARAETVVINGLTVGSFNNSIFLAPSATLLGLTFNGTTFPNPIATADTSAPSFSFLSSNLILGSFTLTGDPATYTGNTFWLQLTYSFVNAPLLDIEPTSLQFPSFPSSLIGTVQSAANGSLLVDFNNAPVVFAVTLGGNLISTFTVTIDDVIIQPGQTVNIVSTVNQTSAVPEPMTLVMLSAGLAGMGTAIRKRRKTV